MEYKYKMTQRGFSLGAQPKLGLISWIDSDNPELDGFYSIIVYNRPLTEEEVNNYELEAI